jgi:ABC transporter with metal-binding/Fe-S-binding domain ATP-binding protein
VKPSKVGILFSGGKDSTLALHKVTQKNEVVCLITLVSLNKESYMFHTPNIEITSLQAEALELPLLRTETRGEQEKELEDLETALALAIKEFKIEGVVTGAVESVYQSTRIQKICDRLNVKCINPIWQKNQKALLQEIVAYRYRVIISGIFAYPLDSTWLGKEIDAKLIDQLVQLHDKFGVSPSGEGGEIETTVLDAPMFKKAIEILRCRVEARGNSGVLIIEEAKLCPK